MRRELWRIGLSLGMLTLLAACGSTSSEDPWIAEVDGEQLPLSELQQMIQVRFEDEPNVPREDILNEELNRLVSRQVVLNRARELGIEVPQREAEVRLRRLHGTDFAGIDPQFLLEVRTEMLMERTALNDLANRIKVSESALRLYFEENRERYRTPARMHIRQIVVAEEEQARRLHAELREGADFATLAAENSLAPEASEGGLLPPFARGEMPEVFESTFKLKPGKLSSVLESPYGFHIFRVEAKLPAVDPKLAYVREQVRMELEQKRLAQLHKDWLRSLRRTANIRVNDRLLESLQ